MPEIISIANREVACGEKVTLDLPVARLQTATELTMPVQIIRGEKDGPVLFICAAIHGDEINGVEIIRRLLRMPVLKTLRGTLVAVPVVNVYGFIHHSRYLPDRRDLNRSFPGSERGSLSSRLADIFMKEIVAKCEYGIDLHTGSNHRTNLPQLRANLDDERTRKLAEKFSPPIILDAKLRDGSLREAVQEMGIPILLYEAGEVLRFDETSIRVGVRGIIRVMNYLGMLAPLGQEEGLYTPLTARATTWTRANESGILNTRISLGDQVKKGDPLATISDPFGENEVLVTAPLSGVIVGYLNLPLVYEGQALFHIAKLSPRSSFEPVMEALNNDEEWEDFKDPLDDSYE